MKVEDESILAKEPETEHGSAQSLLGGKPLANRLYSSYKTIGLLAVAIGNNEDWTVHGASSAQKLP